MDDRKAGIGNYAFQPFKAMENIPFDFRGGSHAGAYENILPIIQPALYPHRDFNSSRERILYEQLQMPQIYNKEYIGSPLR